MAEIAYWARQRAAELINEDGSTFDAESIYTSNAAEALARYIEQHEEAPVDPDVRLVADIINAFERESWVVQDTVMTVDYHRESLMNAVAVYKAHRAKETTRG